MEVSTQVEVVEIDYVCDRCGVGNCRPYGKQMYLSDPPQFLHRCNKCQTEHTFTMKYPYMAYKNIKH